MFDANSSVRVVEGANHNLRAQRWVKGRECLQNSPASLPDDAESRIELIALKYKYRGDLRLIESKDDGTACRIKSPDRADSLMLTFAPPCAQKRLVAAQMNYGGRMTSWDINAPTPSRPASSPACASALQPAQHQLSSPDDISWREETSVRSSKEKQQLIAFSS